MNITLVAVERSTDSTHGQIPQPDSAVMRRRRDELADWREGDGPNGLTVVLKRPAALTCGWIPKPDGFVERRRRDQLAVWREGHGPNRISVPLKRPVDT